MEQKTYRANYNNMQYNIEANWENKRVIINGSDCDNITYDERSRSIYAVIPDSDDSLMVIVNKRKCYIFDYNPDESLMENGAKYIFVKLSNKQKIFMAIFLMLPFSAMSALLNKPYMSYSKVFGIACIYCGFIAGISAITKMPYINGNKKSIFFLATCCAWGIISFLVCLYLLFGLNI